jgi:hypothetical protein
MDTQPEYGILLTSKHGLRLSYPNSAEGCRVERIARLVVILLVVGGVVFGGVALAGGSHGGPKPGKGCGDKNHVHYKQDECKKPPPHQGPGDHHNGGSGDHHGDKGKGHSGPVGEHPKSQRTH